MLWTAPGVKLPSYRKNGFNPSLWRCVGADAVPPLVLVQLIGVGFHDPLLRLNGHLGLNLLATKVPHPVLLLVAVLARELDNSFATVAHAVLLLVLLVLITRVAIGGFGEELVVRNVKG